MNGIEVTIFSPFPLIGRMLSASLRTLNVPSHLISVPDRMREPARRRQVRLAHWNGHSRGLTMLPTDTRSQLYVSVQLGDDPETEWIYYLGSDIDALLLGQIERLAQHIHTQLNTRVRSTNSESS